MKYLYEGPNSGVTLQDGTEVLLWNGKEVELPADNEYVKTLMALGYLKPLQETKETKKTKKEVNENAS
jgi:hypothetical protein